MNDKLIEWAGKLLAFAREHEACRPAHVAYNFATGLAVCSWHAVPKSIPMPAPEQPIAPSAEGGR